MTVATEVLCRVRRLAIERQERDLERLPGLGYTFDEAEADRVVEFFSHYLRHHKGEWAGELFVPEPWQADEVLRPIFGWLRPDGTRRFRTAYIEVPRKMGKTEKAAGIGLYLTGPDGEHGAEVYAIATKEKQAKIVHDAAKAMIRGSPELREAFKYLRNNIHCPDLDAKFEPLGRDSKTEDGLNAHGIIADELHAHRDRHLLDVLQTSTGARRQPLTLIITTAGIYDPESIGWQMHDYAVKVLEGAVQDDAFFAYITAADDGDPWDDPETWAKANPNLGVTVKHEYLEAEARKAKESPSYLNTFLRYHLNIWTQQVTRWLSVDDWKACDETPFDLESLRGRPCFGALDLSSKVDLTALALCFPPTDVDAWWRFWWRFWVPEEIIRRQAERHALPHYGPWVREGWLSPTPGNVVDYGFIRRELRDVAGVVSIRELGYDPWNATQIAVELEQDGFQMVEMRQGARTLSEPSKEFEKLTVAHQVAHGGNPVMRWMVSNAVVRSDPNGNIAPDKEKATQKIDGVVAAIMALGRAIVHRQAPRWVPVEA